MKLRYTLLFILILLIGISLRIYNLDKYNFWYDEIGTILVIKVAKLQHILSYYPYEYEPPLFLLLLSFWLRLGNSEFILRLLPFIFGVLSIPAIYFVGKALFDKKTGLIATFILAISPFHIYYSQELRPYTLVTFLALMVIYYLARSLKENKTPYWAGFIIFTTLILYSHSIALLLIIALNCFFLLFYKRYSFLLRRWLMSQFIILLFYLPWVKIVFEKMAHIKGLNLFQWISTNHLLNFMQTFIVFNLGYNAKGIAHFLAILLFLPLFLFGVWDKNKKEQTYLLLCWLFIPIIIAMIFSTLVFPVYLVRALIYVSTAYYIIIAYGLSKIKLNKVFLYFLLFFGILAGLSLKNYYQNVFPLPEFPYRVGIHPKKEIRLASDYINQNYQKGDIVGHISEATYLPFFYYYNNRLEEKLFTLGYRKSYFRFPKNPLKNLLSSLNKTKKLPILDIREINKSNYNRIWLVFSSWENSPTEQNLKDIKDYLDRNYLMLESKKFAGIAIYLYQIK